MPVRPDPARVMTLLGLERDPWQLDVLSGRHRRLLLNCCRQAGKSTAVALLSLVEAVSTPGALVLLLSRSLRQSTELFRLVTDFHRRLPGYAPTPLLAAPDLAAAAGVGAVLVKDESSRFGLPAFKMLGAAWAGYLSVVARLARGRVERSVSADRSRSSRRGRRPCGYPQPAGRCRAGPRRRNQY